MTDTKMLEELIDKCGLKRGFIAQTLNISNQALYNKIRNITEFKPSEIVIMCKLLNITDLNIREQIFFEQM